MIDLKTEIINMLNEADPDLAKKFIRRFRLVIGQSDEVEQMKALSYFWSIELGMLPILTVEQREFLEPDVTSKVWLQRFRKHILPIVIANKLPK